MIYYIYMRHTDTTIHLSYSQTHHRSLRHATARTLGRPHKADPILSPSGKQAEPRVSPDARWVLYWDSAEMDQGKTAGMRLMRIPISGGAPEPVLQASHGAVIHCSRGHPRCVLSEPDRGNGELVFSTFDPAS